MTANLPATTSKSAGPAAGDHEDLITLTIAGQRFGIPVPRVQDVLGPQRITRVPLASSEIAGSLNLRGRIVTAVDVRPRLGLPARSQDRPGMSVVVDLHGELYSLMVDEVGEVLSLAADGFERAPATLDPRWRDVSGGIHRLDGTLLVVLEIERLLGSLAAA
ncbi:chemotaxis protein CheW [Skermanella aerolata]|uniref:Chemotaxis protein CheW n=1 Tax=Skermanella aerolata TaxID=393310 RepID=A0A512E4Q3_9PROT|nr:chemotaxis protein CheW [Skermanella aerolata]KJB89876.1 chemotaxis protein CheW [Skermanella aerolata KACC 11604]GEO43726.1 chemotaxis protein CheW [Skermanella aerolata]